LGGTTTVEPAGGVTTTVFSVVPQAATASRTSGMKNRIEGKTQSPMVEADFRRDNAIGTATVPGRGRAAAAARLAFSGDAA
jgi:hypothetical protein